MEFGRNEKKIQHSITVILAETYISMHAQVNMNKSIFINMIKLIFIVSLAGIVESCLIYVESYGHN